MSGDKLHDSIQEFFGCSIAVHNHLMGKSGLLAHMVNSLYQVKDDGGSVFIVGTGGSAANALHAAADFRRLCNIQTFTPWDNVAGMSALVNDEGWLVAYVRWLQSYNICANDALFVLSVGGGSVDPPVSENIVEAIQYAMSVSARVMGIVGDPNGYLARTLPVLCLDIEDVSVRTPLAEAYQGLICHMLAWHPLLRERRTKWETIEKGGHDAIPRFC